MSAILGKFKYMKLNSMGIQKADIQKADEQKTNYSFSLSLREESERVDIK